MSETVPHSSPKSVRRRAFTGFGAAMIAVLAFAVYFLLNFTTVVVSGPSMLPTFKSGRRLLASKAYWLVGPLRRDDVVVIREADPTAGTGYFIKRIYRLAGETVDMVNVPKSYKLSEGPYVVPAGTVYVLGDNREVSSDSRELGPIELSRIIGKVVVVR
jgi:signal peptidase I